MKESLHFAGLRQHISAQCNSAGSTVAELRAAYGSHLRISFGTPGNTYRFRIGQGAAGELSGSLSGGTLAATVTGLDAGAVCGE
jgi:hypothetical protein